MGRFSPADENPETANKQQQHITAPPSREGVGLSLEAAWVDFCVALEAEGAAEKTLKTYGEAVSRLITFVHEMGLPDDVAALSGEHLREFFGRLHKTYKPATVSNRYRALRRFFGWLESEDELPGGNPMVRIKPPRIPEVVRPAFTRDELTRLMKATEGRDWLSLRDRAILSTLISTGVRVGELVMMTTDDVRGDSLIITGKGRKQRVVRLGLRAQEAVRRYLRKRRHLPEVRLWLGRTGQPLTVDGVKQLVARRGAEAGVPDCHPHRFRRTFGIRWLESGGDRGDLKVLMGHASDEVLRGYVRAGEEQRALKAHREHDPLDAL